MESLRREREQMAESLKREREQVAESLRRGREYFDNQISRNRRVMIATHTLLLLLEGSLDIL